VHEKSLQDNGVVSEVAPKPVDAPNGRTFVVRIYRAGSWDRFPSAAHAPRPGNVLIAPLMLAGWLLHLTVFRRRWTVAVTPWHNLPGARYRERAATRDDATRRALELSRLVQASEWAPGDQHPPTR
jgi:hypothetical protein